MDLGLAWSDLSTGEPCSISPHEFWTVMHGLVLGTVFLVADDRQIDKKAPEKILGRVSPLHAAVAGGQHA